MNPALHTANPIGTASPIGSQWAELFDGVDDLIHRVADTENPEIRKSRAKVYVTMVAAKNALEQTANQPSAVAQFGDIAGADSPHHSAQKLAVNVLLGLGLGFIASLGR
jgi:hypothetical protein